MPQSEISQPVVLTRPDGTLDPRAIGWTRRPLHRCPLPRGWGRRKRWNHWCVLGEEGALQITLADLDYLGLAVVSFLELASGRLIEVRRASPLGLGIALGDVIGDLQVTLLGLHIDVREERDGTTLRVRSSTLDVDAFIAMPAGHETLGVVVPFGADRFQYTSKHVARPAQADIRAERTHRIEGNGALDFGRGLWPRDTRWNWGVACEGTLGFNLGGQWTDGTGATENAWVSAGRLTKIHDDLAWSWNDRNPQDPWRIRGPALDLRFTPLHVRHVSVHLGIAQSVLTQCFGHYQGAVGSHRVERALGWAEDHAAIW